MTTTLSATKELLPVNAVILIAQLKTEQSSQMKTNLSIRIYHLLHSNLFSNNIEGFLCVSTHYSTFLNLASQNFSNKKQQATF